MRWLDDLLRDLKYGFDMIRTARLISIEVMREAPIPLSSTSPLPYGVVGASLIFAALIAMIGHARRAAKTQPLVALREE